MVKKNKIRITNMNTEKISKVGKTKIEKNNSKSFF